VLSNHRESFDEVEGEVRFGNMDHRQAKRYRQQITFNTEGTSAQPLVLRFCLGGD
jgi:hypothetical protein